MKLDLTNLKIVDDHCHPFDPKREDKGFEQYWTLSMLPIPPIGFPPPFSAAGLMNRTLHFSGATGPWLGS